MSLSIDRLELTLPASLGRRKHAIHRLFRQELAKLDWPTGDWPTMALPTVNLAHNSTNLGVARQLAQQLHGQVWQRSNGLQPGENPTIPGAGPFSQGGDA